MGFRFRKSVKAGPFRINFSKSGVGWSVGGKGYRYTKKANGGTRTTISAPGTGLSYVHETGGKRKKCSSRKKTTQKSSSKKTTPTKNGNQVQSYDYGYVPPTVAYTPPNKSNTGNVNTNYIKMDIDYSQSNIEPNQPGPIYNYNQPATIVTSTKAQKSANYFPEPTGVKESLLVLPGENKSLKEYPDLIKNLNKALLYDTMCNILLVIFILLSFACPFFIILLSIAVISKIALRYSKFVSNINFELDTNQIDTYNRTLDAWKILDSNQYLRLLISRLSIGDSRNCCGVSNNCQRDFMKIIYGAPWFINTNISVVQLKLKDVRVILFPNLFMIISKGNVQIYNGVFDLTAEDTELIEGREAVLPNTSIVRYTYLHVNKNGTPDKRFKENPRIPICLYKHITFNTEFGLNFQILCPNIDASSRFVDEYTKSISSKPVSMFYNVSDKYLSVSQLSVLPIISRVLSIKENNNLTWQNVTNKIQKIPQWPVKDNSIFDIFAKWIDKIFFGSVHYNVTTEKVMALALITNIFALHKVYAGRKISAIVSWIFILFALITRDWMFLFILPWLIIDCIRIYFGNYGRLKSNKTFSFTKFKNIFINKQQNIYKVTSCGISLFCILFISCFCNYTAPPEQQNDFTQGVTIVSSSDNNIALDYVNSTTNDSSKNTYNTAESTLNSESSNLSTIDDGTTTSINQAGIKDPTTKKQTTTTKKQTTTTKKRTTTTKKQTTTTKKRTTTTKKRTTTAVQSDKNGQVWVTASGKKYHNNPDCSNMKNPSKITLANAKAKGYTACKKCYG